MVGLARCETDTLTNRCPWDARSPRVQRDELSRARAVGLPMHDDPVTDERPDVPTVFDRLVAAGLSQESIERHLTATDAAQAATSRCDPRPRPGVLTTT